MATLLEDYLTVEELAAELKCCERTIMRLRNRPDGLPHLQLGGRVLFHRGDVAAWIATQKVRPNPRRRAA